MRNANGTLVGDLVGNKAIIEASWKMLKDSEAKQILNATRAFFVLVNYYEPEQGKYRVAQMYANVNAGQVAVKKGIELWWKNVGCVLYER